MDAPLLRRLRTYQAERFPLVVYVPLMGVAAFAAVSFSAAARIRGRSRPGIGPVQDPLTDGADPAFPWTAWAIGTLTLLVFFFFLRVLDEHKDAPDDARYRPELPVPRGLVTLRELRATALVALAAAIALNALLEPALLVLMAVVLAWAGFMGREFFVPGWLRARPGWYLVSHMVVMPLIFFYATALDWLVAGAGPPPGTGAFLALAFFNGVVIEVGRKVRAPGEERAGVDSYTRAWGLGPATGLWLASVLAAATGLLLAVRGLAIPTAASAGDGIPPGAASWLAGAAGVPAPALAAVVILAVLAAIPALLFLAGSARVRGRHLEAASALWVLGSYALVAALAWLGGVST